MKYLTLIRHAQTEPAQAGQKDIDRVLDRKGQRDAPKMGVKLNELNLNPNKIYISNSVRTVSTSNLLVEQLEYPLGEIEQDEVLYETSVGSLLAFVNKLDDSVHDVTIIAHNPSISYLSEYLTGEEIGGVPSCGVVRMKFDLTEWKLLSKDSGDLIYFVYPQMFDFD